MKYISKRQFKIWAYTVSHSFLLLRSPMLFEDLEEYSEATGFNIDIEFIAVIYIDIPEKLNGITISESVDGIPDRIKYYANSTESKVFEIRSNGYSHYIVAGGFRVGKNNWFSDDRVSNIDLEYDEILTWG